MTRKKQLNTYSNKSDPRLDRLPEFDKRSEEYPITALLPKVAAKKPRSYTWDCKAVLDQGNEGACVGFSMSAELLAKPAVVQGITNESARAVYKKAQTLDQWPGESYQGTSVLAGAKAVQEIYPKAWDSYRWAFGLEDVIQTLGYFGPVVLGINWYSSMFTPDKNGLIKVYGSLAGGHAILARGIDVKKKLIRLHNSWGVHWGLAGNCFISFDDLDRLLHEHGDACVPVGRHKETI